MQQERHLTVAPAARPGVDRSAPFVAHLGMVPKDLTATRMPTTEELNDWMQAVASASDRLAFAALFKHFAPRIKGFLVRSGCTEALAEELAQETMVVLWRRAAAYDPTRAQLSTWLYTIARNVRVDHLRRQQAAGDTGAPVADDWNADELPDEWQPGPDEAVHTARLQRGVRSALAGLPPEQAQVLRLSFFEEYPHSRIAQDLGIPLGTVKSRIRLAVAQLRRLLGALEP